MNNQKRAYHRETLHTHKKALFDYEVIEEYEAGVQLSGAEVKSLRAKSANLKGSYVSIRGGEAWLLGAHIATYKHAPSIRHDVRRDRKLLLKKRDIIALDSRVREKGIALIPVEWYLKGNLIKLKLALARGRKKHDKKQLLKERDINREIEKRFRIRDFD